MTKQEYRAAFFDLAYLCGRAVSGEKPDTERVKAMNLPHLYRAAEFHMLTCACAMALESVGVKDAAFTEAKGKAIRKVALLDREKELLFSRLEAENIWYVPLKGAVLMDIYPAVGMREMVDIDVLFDPACRERLKAIMEEMGFSADRYGIDNHDVYQKPPLYNFEMHTALVDSFYAPTAAAYYETAMARLIGTEQESCARTFSKEDFYIFMLVHGYKHYKLGGIGLRFLLDIVVFLRRFGPSLDQDYIQTELTKLDMAEYARQTEELAEKLYSEQPLSESQQKSLDFYFFSGAKGTKENNFGRLITQKGGGWKGKCYYLFRRAFPPMDRIKANFPTAYRYKILLPFLPFYRLGRALLFRRQTVKKEFQRLKKQ